MNCYKCQQAEYEDVFIQYKMECQNRLFNFEGVPARRCPECGHIFIEESVLHILLFRTKKINQCPGIAYHKAKWGPDLEEEALQSESPDNETDTQGNQKKIIQFIKKNKKRIEDQKITKKNILKLFKWNFDQETGVKKESVVNEILTKIHDKQLGVFTFVCKTPPSSAIDILEYVLLITEDDVWFFAQHDSNTPIYHLI